jgi:serpin B
MKPLLFALLALIPLGCGNPPAPQNENDPPSETTGPTAPEGPAADVTAQVAGNNAFAFDLYRRLRDRPGNLFFSPYSISSALAMTSAGARGDTLKEMTAALHFLEQDRLHPAFTALIRQINSDGKKKLPYELSTANALWGQKGYPFQPPFLKVTREHYGAGLNDVDFAGDLEGSRKTINAWVERQTQDRIKELLPSRFLPMDTRLVLTNAIYFKAGWFNKFSKDDTRDEPFFLADGEKTKAPLMHQQFDLLCYEGKAFQALEIPYLDKAISLLVLLPRKPDRLTALENDLAADRVTAIIDELEPRRVNVYLPKFKMTDEFALRQQLEALGMKKAFTNEADFAGINDNKPEELKIAAVMHKTFIAVDEEGTEAAGATAVVMKSKDGPARPREPVTFRADRPFVFLIRDRRSDSILFLGRVADPTK